MTTNAQIVVLGAVEKKGKRKPPTLITKKNGQQYIERRRWNDNIMVNIVIDRGFGVWTSAEDDLSKVAWGTIAGRNPTLRQRARQYVPKVITAAQQQGRLLVERRSAEKVELKLLDVTNEDDRRLYKEQLDRRRARVEKGEERKEFYDEAVNLFDFLLTQTGAK